MASLPLLAAGYVLPLICVDISRISQPRRVRDLVIISPCLTQRDPGESMRSRPLVTLPGNYSVPQTFTYDLDGMLPFRIRLIVTTGAHIFGDVLTIGYQRDEAGCGNIYAFIRPTFYGFGTCPASPTRISPVCMY